MADFSLDSRVALVTGASRGLGRHFAGVLAKAGAAVALASRQQDLLAEAVREIEAAGGRAVAVPLDVTDGAERARHPPRPKRRSARSISSSTMPASRCRSRC